MLGQLAGMQRLVLDGVWQLTPVDVAVLQCTLPKLSYVRMHNCGGMIPQMADNQRAEREAVATVRRSLRAGMQLEVLYPGTGFVDGFLVDVFWAA
jgi:hypothetical protein